MQNNNSTDNNDKNIKNKVGRTLKFNYLLHKPILDDYFSCKITLTQAKERVGFSTRTNGSWYKIIKHYMELNNIQSYQNNLDVVMKNSTLEKGKKIGYVRYKDGKHIIYRY